MALQHSPEMWFCDSTIKLYDVDGLNELFAKDKKVSIQKPESLMCGAKRSKSQLGKKDQKVCNCQLTTADRLVQRQMLPQMIHFQPRLWLFSWPLPGLGKISQRQCSSFAYFSLGAAKLVLAETERQ